MTAFSRSPSARKRRFLVLNIAARIQGVYIPANGNFGGRADHHTTWKTTGHTVLPA